MNIQNKKFLTLEDVQELLGKGRTMIYYYRKEGKLVPFGMCGKSPLFRLEDVEKFLIESLQIN